MKNKPNNDVSSENFEKGVYDLIQHRPDVVAKVLIQIVTQDNPTNYRQILAYIQNGIAMSGADGKQIHPTGMTEWGFITESVLKHVQLMYDYAVRVRNEEELAAAKVEVETRKTVFDEAIQSINSMPWWRRLFRRFKF